MPSPITDKAAVLVIDVQTGLFCAEPLPFDGAGVVRRINETTTRARQAGVPVFLVQHEDEAEGLGYCSEAWKLHPDLETAPGDIRLRKKTCDAFYGTSLDAELRSRQVETLIITGYATDFCVDSTVRNAMSKGYSVVVVSDAHTTPDNPVLSAELVRRHHNWAWSLCTAPRPVRVCRADELRF